MVVHNETSTGVTSRIGEIRAAIDKVGHPALLLVDTISSLGSVDYRHDEWKVDVTVCCSQKGFMLPPGLGFNAISEKARAAAKTNKMPRSYWDWEEMLKPNAAGFFPYTPATNLLYGLREAIAMLLEEGLDNVFARHKRLAAATRAAVTHWGLEVLCLEPSEYSPVLTAVLMPPGHDADKFRKIVLDNYNMSLGSGLIKARRQGVSHRPSRRVQRTHLDGRLVRRRDGACRRRRAAPGRRGRSRDEIAGRAHHVEFSGASEGGQDLTATKPRDDKDAETEKTGRSAQADRPVAKTTKEQLREEEDAASVQAHSCRAGDALHHVLHHLCRPGEHRHGGQRDPEGT